MERYIGLMSGTSLDGVDAVILQIDAGTSDQSTRFRIEAHASLPLPDDLRAELLALHEPSHDELTRAALAANRLARLYAQACDDVLRHAGLSAASIRAIGAHGQTIRHRPDQGFTLQLNAPALLAELTGIAVIADFRSRDVAAGGQGAPLVPAFHAAAFRQSAPQAILNLGGIANLTILRPDAAPQGFDTGPANMLMDAWCLRHTNQPYDRDGNWAGSGQCLPDLLAALISSEPWFDMTPPKSTGRDLFSLHWLDQRLASHHGHALRPEDVQATLLALTVHTICHDMARHAADASRLLVCGGGAANRHLMQALTDALPCKVMPTDMQGIPAQQVEAAAFGWLAHAFEQAIPAGLPEVTGARRATILGARYPA
ncbi:anhydro-N-acetylmuramic acid kinase [Corticimicrobacter populi]|uniref:Anhydro-N-acetylmuramic acid kinase n=1 Tax=Corticimicrobacter populi TaxID=2175229 RepID=A0A2V1K1F9_9BURK|nr:anhydro-N-acetylmuramic acid kinase [Corticimicrobacter populi]PWF24971.1 anhydro-N-acetylmuramic acid kinase [Corticimicrobacter populi]